MGLDEITKGRIVTNNIVKELIKNISEDYKIASPSSATDNAVNEFIDDVNNNLDSAVSNHIPFTWANELSKISNLKDIDTSNMETLGAKLDNACDGSVLITKATIAKMFKTVSNSYKQ